MKISKEIRQIFKIRDEAVIKKDRKLFLSTQIDEIQGGGSKDYIALDSMSTKVLYECDENELKKVVFVKETYVYTPNGKEPYSSFPVYFLADTKKGWKIFKVR